MRVVSFGLALAGELLLLALLNRFDDWTLAEMPVRFVICAIACGIAYLFATTRFPAWLSLTKQAAVFWSVAIALRLIALPLEAGDDFWRYQWEGKIQHDGFNPYVTAPDDPALTAQRAQFPHFDKINHRDFRAIYPPGAELLFAALTRVSDNPLLYKLLFAAADLATAVVLLRIVSHSSTYATAAWYAWNPLVIYSFAGAAHFDSLMVLPMVAGIMYLVRQEAETNRAKKWILAVTAAALFGAAISLKLIPL